MRGQTDVIVAGGGIAGIAAALRLAEQGASVLVLETRKKLGGRATSFLDARTGRTIDNCQHVALGCCTNYLDLCARLGVSDSIEWHESIYWVEAGGRTSVMAPGLLPAPAHLSGAFLRARFLSLTEKHAIGRAMLKILRTDRDAVDPQATFGDWLRSTGQPDGALRKFWEPVVVSACNLTCDRVAARTALHVFQEGFLATRSSASMGVSRVPLIQLYDPAEDAIARVGGRIRLGVSVSRISSNDVETTSGDRFTAGSVICALPPERAARFIDPTLQATDPRFGGMADAAHSPIIGVHLTFDRPVMPTPNAVLVDRPTQWLFRKDERGREVHAVISAADEWVGLGEVAIGERVLADIKACFPEQAGPAQVRSGVLAGRMNVSRSSPRAAAAAR
ncbi:MAG: hydroxysqualene dehydroxylase HpnE [Planctomycetota bacterium]